MYKQDFSKDYEEKEQFMIKLVYGLSLCLHRFHEAWFQNIIQSTRWGSIRRGPIWESWHDKYHNSSNHKLFCSSIQKIPHVLIKLSCISMGYFIWGTSMVNPSLVPCRRVFVQYLVRHPGEPVERITGNNRPWKEPGTPQAKYRLSVGRDAKRVLKSLAAWSLKNTWNSGMWDLRPSARYLLSTGPTICWIATKVFGPTEHPKSARQNVFVDNACTSSFSAIASSIIDLEAFAHCLCKIYRVSICYECFGWCTINPSIQ